MPAVDLLSLSLIEASEARQAVGKRTQGDLCASVGHVGNVCMLSICPVLVHGDADAPAVVDARRLGARREAPAPKLVPRTLKEQRKSFAVKN